VRNCVKVDDTVTGIEEGLRAGMWTVGVTMTGNEVGLPQEELSALPPQTRADLARDAAARLRAAGAHYVIDGIGQLMPVIDDIEARMAHGEQP
jgi:phosphonoacetaldehyde hydrolase